MTTEPLDLDAIRAEHYDWVNPDYPDLGPYCAECGVDAPCATVLLVAELERMKLEIRTNRPTTGCICDYNPETTDGPEEDCPQHGRPYAYWVEGVATLAAENAALRAAEQRVRALQDAADWLTSLASSGPDLTINAHRKAAHEAAELAANPSLEEMADVIICLVGTAVHQGWSYRQVMDAVSTKNAVNAGRSWTQEPDGTWEHVAALDGGQP